SSASTGFTNHSSLPATLHSELFRNLPPKQSITALARATTVLVILASAYPDHITCHSGDHGD
ncbi:MAG: hypothetical protein ABW209_10475, partial [Pseudomonas caspiana]